MQSKRPFRTRRSTRRATRSSTAADSAGCRPWRRWSTRPTLFAHNGNSGALTAKKGCEDIAPPSVWLSVRVCDREGASSSTTLRWPHERSSGST
eukprot:2638887-Prymnesium_polylepis.1